MEHQHETDCSTSHLLTCFIFSHFIQNLFRKRKTRPNFLPVTPSHGFLTIRQTPPSLFRAVSHTTERPSIARRPPPPTALGRALSPCPAALRCLWARRPEAGSPPSPVRRAAARAAVAAGRRWRQALAFVLNAAAAAAAARPGSARPPPPARPPSRTAAPRRTLLGEVAQVVELAGEGAVRGVVVRPRRLLALLPAARLPPPAALLRRAGGGAGQEQQQQQPPSAGAPHRHGGGGGGVGRRRR